ncbi:hypothetical protein BDN70DRAFT_180568 [Pholiota conissans]|uniref:Uncharacterized protein n=1 Tax=Pholiota conissans TaxID=109636 RepID=A0A9P6CYJ3_9AGAR|nr:hypothetical protein BDN70DRAFT_180568 [Pholiota conissans]
MLLSTFARHSDQPQTSRSPWPTCRRILRACISQGFARTSHVITASFFSDVGLLQADLKQLTCRSDYFVDAGVGFRLQRWRGGACTVAARSMLQSILLGTIDEEALAQPYHFVCRRPMAMDQPVHEGGDTAFPDSPERETSSLASEQPYVFKHRPKIDGDPWEVLLKPALLHLQ